MFREAGPPAAPPGPEVRRRQRLVMVGLLLSLAGLFLSTLLLPVGSAEIDRVLPVIAAGLATLWIGGILLGLGSPRRGRR